MSFEQAKESINTLEEAKVFEELSYTRDFGVVKQDNILNILKENSEYWRLPTLAEMYALYKKNKSKFFKYKSYWAGNNTSELREFRISMLGRNWYFSKENSDNKYLVLFKKGTYIEGTDDKKIEEELNSIGL